MRQDNIEVEFRIPLTIGKPDGNGVIYTKEAILNSLETTKGKPIIQLDSNGNQLEVGIVKDAQYQDDYLYIWGLCWHGGTCEDVEFETKGIVTSMNISSVGICL